MVLAVKLETGVILRGSEGSHAASGVAAGLSWSSNCALKGECLCEPVGRFGVKGILRLRDCFASRTSHFAQDDRVEGSAKNGVNSDTICFGSSSFFPFPLNPRS